MERAEVVDERLSSALEDTSPDGLWSLSSELNALKASAALRKDKKSAQTREAVDDALDVVRDFHEFSVEMRSEIESKDYSQMASIFDLTAIGALAAQDVLPGVDGLSLPKILLGALSEGLIFLGSRQYVAGAQKIVNARLRIHSHRVYERLWGLPMDFKKQFMEENVAELQVSIDEFFKAFLREDGASPPKVAVLLQFYSLILAIQVEKVMMTLR
ncbi:MAG: hypothetical protein LN415_07645 [Candidatus Thermoplasmatota archaeon]|nr:hypothetical protein [Candidatus Thermoplasmatota archaeon]